MVRGFNTSLLRHSITPLNRRILVIADTHNKLPPIICELARRLQDQTTKFPVMSKQRQNRKCEGGGFASAGLGGADQILAGENNGEGAKLDRGRFGKTHCLDAAHHFSRKIEIVKTHVWKVLRRVKMSLLG